MFWRTLFHDFCINIIKLMTKAFKLGYRTNEETILSTENASSWKMIIATLTSVLLWSLLLAKRIRRSGSDSILRNIANNYSKHYTSKIQANSVKKNIYIWASNPAIHHNVRLYYLSGLFAIFYFILRIASAL